MAKLLAAIEPHKITVERLEMGATVALINGQRVGFVIFEEIQQKVTQKPRVAHPQHSWDYERLVAYAPTGALVLAIQTQCWKSQLRKRWADGKTQRVEDMIPDFVAGLMRTAIVLAEEAEERKQREIGEFRRKQELVELRKLVEEEEAKLKQLECWMDAWDRAERMRRFIAFYSDKTKSWPSEKQQRRADWIQWANEQANRMDPFVVDKPNSVLDRKHELSRW